jgi:acyl-CoA synthetase (AMP-forming)/AMP-acid ligase II
MNGLNIILIYCASKSFIYMENAMTIHGELRKRSTTDADRTAMKDARSELTFAELNTRANKIAKALRESGFESGDMLAVLLSNRLEWGEIQYGCFLAGVVPAGINFRFAPAQAVSAIQSIDADGFIFESQYDEMVQEIREEVDIPDDRFVELGPDPAYRSYENFRNAQSGEKPTFSGQDLDDPAVVWFTSGTTGQPKPIVWTQESLIDHFLMSGTALSINDEASSFLLMPFFHANSQLYFMGSLYVGADVYVHRATGFDPEETLELIEAEESTFTSMVPTHYNQMLHDAEMNAYDLSSLEIVLSSSAPLSLNMKRELNEVLSQGVAEAYGASETGIPLILRPGASAEKIGSIGTPMQGSDAIIVDPETHEPVKPGTIGEIYMRVPCGMERYHELPEKTAGITIERNGHTWMTAGDMGRVDEDGYFYIENRKDDMIITGGENVYPQQIEDIMHEHQDIKDVAVVGIPDEKWGERIHAVAIPSGDEKPSIDDIQEFCRGKIADYEIPKGIDYVSELPRNSTGKVLRTDIR